MSTETWETLCRRTEYPKLGYIITRLEKEGVRCRFAAQDGRVLSTFHARYILEVPALDAPRAWAILLGPSLCPGHEGETLDAVPDDHPAFDSYDNIFPCEDAAETEAWLYGEDPFGAKAQEEE